MNTEETVVEVVDNKMIITTGDFVTEYFFQEDKTMLFNAVLTDMNIKHHLAMLEDHND
jgi:hypothetical protein